MIKRWLVSLLLFFVSMSWGMAADYVGKEQKYAFSADNLKQTVLEMIPDEDGQLEAVKKYGELENPSTGMVSIENLFAVCRAAGFNTYRIDGYNQCRNFIMKLLENAELEDDSGIMGGFCPGLDEKGNNPNGLKSITDQTRIGDFCSSTNIYSGEVVFRKQTYNCTCMATACNQGFQIKGGACNTIVADGNGNCLRKEYDGNAQNSSRDGCFKFCGDMGDKLGCKANTSIWDKNKNKCTCNATYDEVDAVRQARIDALPYSAVCGDDKGKTGGKEYCVKGVFNWINIGVIEASGIAEEYARVKHGKTVHCSDHYRKSGNDDWMQCVTEDKSTFYEFQFDDVKESVDARIQGDLKKAICKIYDLGSTDFDGDGYDDSCKGKCNESLKKTAKKFGMGTTGNNKLFTGDVCTLTNKTLGKNDKDKLAKIDGVDNYIFYHGIQIQATQDLTRKLRQYVAGSVNYEVKTFNCDKGSNKIMNGNIETDDIIRCYVNGQPIDFVFDDKSEMNPIRQKGGQQGINCIVTGGTFSGKGCLGLSEQLCQKVAAQDAKSCPECKAARWDSELQQCILPAGAAARNLEQGIKVGTIVVAAVAGAAITVATGGAAGAGAALLLVEVVGATVETVQTVKMQQVAVDFLNASNKCRDAQCAEPMIKDNFRRLANMQNEFAAAEVNAIDSEMARLFELIPETSDLYNGARLEDNQLSMFDSDSWEPEQVWRAIGVGLQMASLVTSIGKWILGKVPRLAKTTTVVTTKMQKALPAAKTMKALPAHADDAAKLALKNGDDAAKLALGSGDDAARLALGSGDDATRLALGTADDTKALTAGVMERADAKHLQDIAEREAKRAAGTATKHEREMAKADHQLRNQIYNRYAASIGSGENVEMAGKAVMKSEQIAAVEADLAKAQQNLKWATEHAGQVSKTELASRQAQVERITQQLADLGVTYNKVDDVATASVSATRAANAASDVTTSAIRATDAVADGATDIARTGVSRSEAFAEIGIKETIVNGKPVYTDLKTGAQLSETQVLNKIPTSWNDEMAQYGLRQIELSNGSVRYMDIGVDGGNKFISQENAYNRVGQMLADSGNKVDDVAGATRNASRAADEATDAARNAGKAADAATDAARGAAGAARSIDELDDLYQIGQKATTREEILKKWGLRLEATDAEIRKRYLDLANKFHPDKAGLDDVLRGQISGVMSDINAERDLLGKLPKVSNVTNNVDNIANNVDNMARALPMPSGVTPPPVTPVVTPVAPTATTAAKDFSTFGHDLIGIMAGTRAADRANQ